MMALLLACTTIEVWGDSAPEPPEGFTTTVFEVPADGIASFEIAAETTAMQLHVRIVDPNRRHQMVADLVAGPSDLVGLHVPGALRPELVARWPDHPHQAATDLSGTWEFVLHGPYNRDAEVTVQQWVDPDPLTGTLHVQVVFTDGTGSRNAEVEQAIAVWQDIWAPHGIEVVPYYQASSAPSACPDALDRYDGNAIYEQMSAAGADHDLTLVICDTIDGELSSVSFGGPLVASRYAAVAIALTDSPSLMGQAMAHQVSHTIGLLHAEDDDLSDTPDCTDDCEEVLGKNNLYSAPVCRDGDDPEAVDGCWVQDELTSEQVWLLQNWLGVTE